MTITPTDTLCQKTHTFKHACEAFTPEVPEISVVHERGRGIAWRIWPAAHILVKWLGENKKLWLKPNTHVIEIGAGVGLVGVCCAAMGASRVTLTDLDEALPALERTRESNVPDCMNRLHVERLSFGSLEDSVAVVAAASEAERARRPIVVGSDLVYFESLFAPLAECIADLCSNHNAIVYLAYKKRIWRNEKRFFSKILPQHGLQATPVFECTVDEEDGCSQHTDGRVVDNDEAEGWNSRIFKITKGADPVVPRAPVVVSVAAAPKRKAKKGKVPVSKEKQGRIR